MVVVGISTGLFKEKMSLNNILDVKRAGINFFEESPYSKISPQVLDNIENNDMEVYSIHEDARSGKGDISDLEDSVRIRSIEDCKKRIKKINKLGGELITIHPGGIIDGNYKRETRVKNSINSLTILAKYAYLYDVKIAVENLHGRYLGNGIDEVCYIFKKVRKNIDSKNNIGICLDTGHAFLTNDLFNYLDLCKSDIFSIHIHDNLGVNVNTEMLDPYDLHIVPGQGIIDWKKFFNKLINNNYKGPIIFEVITDDNGFKKGPTIDIKYKSVLKEISNFIKGEVFLSWFQK